MIISYYSNSYNNGCYSAFDTWGRWVVLAVVLVVFFFFFCICSYVPLIGHSSGRKLTFPRAFSSRRRRRRGLNPYYGTGWMAGKTPAGHAPATYTGPQNYATDGREGAAPPYAPPANNTYYPNNTGVQQGYYGQENGIELQTPHSTYQPARGGDPVYTAPSGPPPGKDGIIR